MLPRATLWFLLLAISKNAAVGSSVWSGLYYLHSCDKTPRKTTLGRRSFLWLMVWGCGVSAEKFLQPVTGHQQPGSRERRMLVLSPLSLTQCGASDHIHSGLPLQLNLSGKYLTATPRGVSLILNLAVILNGMCLNPSKDVECSWVVFQPFTQKPNSFLTFPFASEGQPLCLCSLSPASGVCMVVVVVFIPDSRPSHWGRTFMAMVGVRT